MLWVYGHYKYVCPFSAETVFICHILTYKDDLHAVRVKFLGVNHGAWCIRTERYRLQTSVKLLVIPNFPTKYRHGHSFGLMLNQRRRQWAIIKPTFYPHLPLTLLTQKSKFHIYSNRRPPP